jgi:hypothetical protein
LSTRSSRAGRANTLVSGQLARILDDRQVAAIPPWRPRPIVPLAPLEQSAKPPVVNFAYAVIRAILARRFLALSTEELISEPAILTAWDRATNERQFSTRKAALAEPFKRD